MKYLDAGSITRIASNGTYECHGSFLVFAELNFELALK